MKLRNNENDEGLSFGIIGLLVCAGLLVAVAALAAAFSASAPTGALQTQSQSDEAAVVRISSEGGAVFEASVSINESSTAFDVLRAAAAAKNLALEHKTYPGMGVLVTRIGDGRNGAGGAYWQYWINGAYATVSADNAAIHPNDVLEWRLTSSAQ